MKEKIKKMLKEQGNEDIKITFSRGDYFIEYWDPELSHYATEVWGVDLAKQLYDLWNKEQREKKLKRII